MAVVSGSKLNRKNCFTEQLAGLGFAVCIDSGGGLPLAKNPDDITYLLTIKSFEWRSFIVRGSFLYS
jgi:hypothetical protein